MSRLSSRRLLARRHVVYAACAAPIAGLLAVAAFAPLPYAVAQPGLTANVLGDHEGEPVITVRTKDDAPGQNSRPGKGRLLMTTIAATTPDTDVRLKEVVKGWLDSDRAVMPKDAVYPKGDSSEEIKEHNTAQMEKSQYAAVEAALSQLRLSASDVDVKLRLADIGGPSAGLLFALGVIEKLDGDGRGGDLTDGRTIAGTGTITTRGKVGPVGGVPLKTQAAKRDGATVFLVPRAECSEAKAELPDGLRLIPADNLVGTLEALKALADGGEVPRC